MPGEGCVDEGMPREANACTEGVARHQMNEEWVKEWGETLSSLRNSAGRISFSRTLCKKGRRVCATFPSTTHHFKDRNVSSMVN